MGRALRLGAVAMVCVLTACSADPETVEQGAAGSLSSAPDGKDDRSGIARAVEVVSLIDRYGLHATGAEWESTKGKVLAQLAAASQVSEAYYPLDVAVREGGGPHSRFLEKPTDPSDVPSYPAPAVSISGGITTIAMTYDPPTDALHERDVAAVTAGIEKNDRTTCGWIVDLRNHTGGGVVPIFRALAPLLPDGVLVGFRDRDGKDMGAWRIKGRALLWEPQIAGPGLPQETVSEWSVPAEVRPRPIAVLQSSLTASAAEAGALSFIGLREARSFGAPTRGFTSGNVSLPGPAESTVILTLGTMTDRVGYDYGEKPIPPLRPAPPDRAGEEAVSWLNSVGCR